MNFFTVIFQGFCRLFRNTYLKEDLEWLLPFISIERLYKGIHISYETTTPGSIYMRNTSIKTISRGTLIY